MMTGESVELLVETLRDVQASRYLAVIAFTAYMYDWSILLADEVELVGKSRLSLGKVLYIITRIITALGLAAALIHIAPELRGSTELPNQFCTIFAYVLPVAEVTSFLASYWLIMLRLVALYKSRPYFIYFLYTSLIACWIVTYTFLVMALVFFSNTIEYSDVLGLCSIAHRAPTLAGVFVAPLFFDILLIILTFAHAWKGYRGYNDPSTSRLIWVLYRDGVVFSAIMAGIRIWNIVIYSVQPLSRTYLGPYVMWAAITMLSCRIYLNVVQVARHKGRDRELTSHIAPNVNLYNRDYGECESAHGLTMDEGEEKQSKLGGILRLSNRISLPVILMRSKNASRESVFDLEALSQSKGQGVPTEPARFPRVIGRELPPKKKASKSTINLSIHIQEEIVVTDESGSVRRSIPSVPQTPRSFRTSVGSTQRAASPEEIESTSVTPKGPVSPLQVAIDERLVREPRRSRSQVGPCSPTGFVYPPDSPTRGHRVKSLVAKPPRARPRSDQSLQWLKAPRSPTLSRISVSNPLRRPRTAPTSSQDGDLSSFLPSIN